MKVNFFWHVSFLEVNVFNLTVIIGFMNKNFCLPFPLHILNLAKGLCNFKIIH